MKENNKFIIDEDEFAFLVEACIPPKPIARTMFWKKVINEYFYQMNWEQRIHLWTWISKNPNYSEGLSNEEENILFFEARFNPDNQYIIYSSTGHAYECFLLDYKYYTQTNKFIIPENVMGFEKLEIYE